MKTPIALIAAAIVCLTAGTAMAAAETKPDNAATNSSSSGYNDTTGYNDTNTSDTTNNNSMNNNTSDSNTSSSYSGTSDNSTSATNTSMNMGRNSLSKSEVRDVQQALSSRGFYKGRVDGVWGARTSDAIRQFHKSRNENVSDTLNSSALGDLGVSVDDNSSSRRGM